MIYKNIGLLYNKHYYEGINYQNIGIEDNINKLQIKNEVLLSSNLQTVEDKIGTHHFQLASTYPGILFGSGYMHQGDIQGEFKFGVSFDHSTGMPVYPGSSLKGMLRSAFSLAEGGYITELFEELNIVYKGNIEDLETLIFGHKEGKSHPLSVYQQDIFLDSYPVGTGQFLKSDYITAHKDNPLKNPNPIQFLCIKSNIGFRFNFILKDHEKGLTAKDKQKLFKQIILDLGIGAKTNVGYGQFALNPIGNIEMPNSSDIDDGLVWTTVFKNIKEKETYTFKLIGIRDNGYYRELLFEHGETKFIKREDALITAFEKKSQKRIIKEKPGNYSEIRINDSFNVTINSIANNNFSISPNWIKII